MKADENAWKKVKEIYLKSKTGPVSTPPSTVLKNAITKHGGTEDVARAIFTIAMKKDTLDVPDDMSLKDAKICENLFKTARAVWEYDAQARVDLKEKAEKEKAEKEKAEKEAGTSIMLSASKGFALSEAATTSVVSAAMESIQATLGEKFTVTEMGITLNKGEKLTAEEAAQGIGTLASISERFTKVGTLVGWALGDFVNIVEKSIPNGRDIVLNAVSINGQSKHTIIQASRLCAAFPPNKRIPGFTFTHHQEILNYGEKVPINDLRKIIEKAVDVEAVVVTPTGKEIVQRKPASVRKLREMLQEASTSERVKKPKKDDSGKSDPEPPKNPEPETPGKQPGMVISPVTQGSQYLYINGDGVVFKSIEFSEIASKSGDFLVVDLVAMCMIGEDGAEGARIENLGEEYFAKKSEAKKQEPKIRPASKSVTPPEPEPGNSGDPNDDIPE